MSLSSIGAGVSAGAVGQITAQNTISTSPYQFSPTPMWNEDNHIFNCHKVENGWTLEYRNKRFIAADLDSLMDQMKAAMVMERIDK